MGLVTCTCKPGHICNFRPSRAYAIIMGSVTVASAALFILSYFV